MAKRSVHVESAIGPGVVNKNSSVLVRPAYRFVDGTVINWPDQKRFLLENGEVTIPGMEDTYDGADLVWEFEFENLDSRNQPLGPNPIELVSFEGTAGSTVEYVDMMPMTTAPLPDYLQSAVVQAEAARDAALAVGDTNDTIMTAVFNDDDSDFWNAFDQSVGPSAMANPETAANAAVLDVVNSAFGGSITGVTLDFEGSLTNLTVARPSWSGRVNWLIPEGATLPTHLIDGDLVTEVAVDPIPWTPLGNVPLLRAWWAPNAGYSPGEAITDHPDLSGNGHTLEAYLSGVTYSATGMNGHPCLAFNDAGALNSVGWSPIADGTISVWWNGKSANTYVATSNTGTFFDGQTSGQLQMARSATSTNTNFLMRRGGSGTAASAASDSSLHSFLGIFKKSGASTLWIDGTQVGSASSTGGVDLTGMFVGCNGSGANPLDGVIGDIVVHGGTPSTDTSTNMWAFLNAGRGV